MAQSDLYRFMYLYAQYMKEYIYYCGRGLQVTEFYTCNRASMLRPTLLYLFYARILFATWRISHLMKKDT